MILDEQSQLIKETVAKFVERELFPLEPQILNGMETKSAKDLLTAEQNARLKQRASALGLTMLEVPEELGGLDLSAVAMVGVNEEMGRTIIPFLLSADSPNLRMLQAVGTAKQKERYLKPYMEGKITSAIGISEPGAGGDPAAIRTRATLDGDQWSISGRKIWISNAQSADFIIVMARVGEGKRHDGITSFIVESGTPGFIIERIIPMLGGVTTCEIVFENCRIPKDAVLGDVGKGYSPMQLRLTTRRLEMGARAVGMTRRALSLLVDHATQRETFGVRLSDRQAIQWWIADIATRLHVARLMLYDAAEKVDAKHDVRLEASMIKVHCTEMAYAAIDYSMQTLGALGMTKEVPLYWMWQRARLMRVYEGPSEVHRQSIATQIIKGLR
jgi:acyl-CoA dehydrogenase